MTIIYYALFGLLVGSLANWIDPHKSSGGLLGSMLLGIAGAVVGGYIGEALFGVGVDGFNLPSILVAVAGSLLLMAVIRMFRGRSAV